MAQTPTSPLLAGTLDTREVCQRVGISRWTLNRWVARGVFPAPTDWPGKGRRWRKSDVEAFVRWVTQTSKEAR